MMKEIWRGTGGGRAMPFILVRGVQRYQMSVEWENDNIS